MMNVQDQAQHAFEWSSQNDKPDIDEQSESDDLWPLQGKPAIGWSSQNGRSWAEPQPIVEKSATTLEKARNKLSTYLADLYKGQDDAYRVAKEAGLDIADIKSGDNITDLWREILRAAEKQGQVEALINKVIEEQGDSPDFLAVYNPYFSALKSRLVLSSPTRPKKKVHTPTNSQVNTPKKVDLTKVKQQGAMQAPPTGGPPPQRPIRTTRSGNDLLIPEKTQTRSEPISPDLGKPQRSIDVRTTLKYGVSLILVVILTCVIVVISLIATASVVDYLNIQSDLLWLSSGFVLSIMCSLWVVRRFNPNRTVQSTFNATALLIAFAVILYTYVRVLG